MNFHLPKSGNRGDEPVMFDPLSRRNFLKFSGGCASLSSTAILSQLLNLHLTKAAVADDSEPGGYKALVCIFMLGGVDSFNMITPYVDEEYNDYVVARGGLANVEGSEGLALDKDDTNGSPEILPIDVEVGGTRKLGIHAGMPGIKELYDSGNAAVIANVGSLVVPTTRANYNVARKPLGLFSHSDLIKHWQTAVPQSRSEVTGWGGRMADMLADTNSNENIAMNIALGSLNTYQTGAQTVPYVVNDSGAQPVFGLYNGNGRNSIYNQITNQIYPTDPGDGLSSVYSDLLQRTLAQGRRLSIDAADAFNTATAEEPVTAFPDTSLGKQLKMVAKTIKGRSMLGQGRQIFFVSAGGWDHHDDVIDKQAAMLPQVSEAIKAFYDETKVMGVENNVTTFTASDFGRTLSSNGNGSDHAWGGNHLVIGGAVDGGRVYGEYPESLALDNNLDVGRGRLIPTTSVDEYSAELAMWFGVANTDSDLKAILPNIRNFYGAGGTTGPLGFLTGGSTT